MAALLHYSRRETAHKRFHCNPQKRIPREQEKLGTPRIEGKKTKEGAKALSWLSGSIPNLDPACRAFSAKHPTSSAADRWLARKSHLRRKKNPNRRWTQIYADKIGFDQGSWEAASHEFPVALNFVLRRNPRTVSSTTSENPSNSPDLNQRTEPSA